MEPLGVYMYIGIIYGVYWDDIRIILGLYGVNHKG